MPRSLNDFVRVLLRLSSILIVSLLETLQASEEIVDALRVEPQRSAAKYIELLSKGRDIRTDHWHAMSESLTNRQPPTLLEGWVHHCPSTAVEGLKEAVLDEAKRVNVLAEAQAGGLTGDCQGMVRVQRRGALIGRFAAHEHQGPPGRPPTDGAQKPLVVLIGGERGGIEHVFAVPEHRREGRGIALVRPQRIWHSKWDDRHFTCASRPCEELSHPQPSARQIRHEARATVPP
jgi:hypothetical protein